MIEGLPLPATDDPNDSAFWDAARAGRLVVQSCADCGKVRFPPRPMCPHCRSERPHWISDSGAATIWSFATPRPPLLPAFEAMLPYVTVIGALDSNPAIRIAAIAVASEDAAPTGLTAKDVALGQPVEMRFRFVTSACALPVWLLGARRDGAQ